MPDYKLATRRAAKKFGVNPAILEALIQQESGFNPNAKSPAGAQGIAQFMPGTAPGYGVNLHDNRVTDDLEGAAKYIAANLKRTGGNYHQALSIYNSGKAEGYKSIPETKNYVSKILSAAGRVGGGQNPSGGSSQARTTSVSTPGVDNSALRAQAVQDFLGSKSANPVSFAMAIRNAQDVPGKTSVVPSNATGVVGAGGSPDTAKLVSRANAINAKQLPYQWGGGHGGKVNAYQAQPLDCSGAVSAVLGINPKVSGQFESFGKPGDGGSKGVTIAANGHHVLMKIDGHWFGTSGSNPGGGAGWIPQNQISPQYLRGFKLRHA